MQSYNQINLFFTAMPQQENSAPAELIKPNIDSAPVETIQPAVPPVEEKKKSKVPVILIVVIIILLVCGVLALFMFPSIVAFFITLSSRTEEPAAIEQTQDDTSEDASNSEDEVEEEKIATFTSEPLGLNAAWAPTLVTISDPISAVFEFPTEYGNPTITYTENCGDLHAGKPEVKVTFDNSDAIFSFFTCGLGDIGIREVGSHELTTKDGDTVTATAYAYVSEEDGSEIRTDYYLMNVNSEVVGEIYLTKEILRSDFDIYKVELGLIVESIDL